MLLFHRMRSFSIKSLAALDIGIRCKQPFDCLITRNRQAMYSTGRLMYWTMKYSMVNRPFFCATLTHHRRDHTPFVKVGVETSDTGVKAIKPDPC